MQCRVSIGWMSGESFFSRGIRLFQTTFGDCLDAHIYPYSHAILMYDFTRSNDDWLFEGKYGGKTYSHSFKPSIYKFESVIERNYNPLYAPVGKNGIRGPVLMTEENNWPTESVRVPLYEGVLESSLAWLFWAREHCRYAHTLQFLSHMLRLWSQDATPKKCQCAETIVRALCTRDDGKIPPNYVRGFDLVNWTADQFTPRLLQDAAYRIASLDHGDLSPTLRELVKPKATPNSRVP